LGAVLTRAAGERFGLDFGMILLCSPAGCVVAPQAIAVLRNVARETSQRKIGHKIRKVIRQEAAKWAGLGTPESDARIAEMERQIAERGGVCVVKSDEEIARLMAEREREEAVA
jgi:electron transfer flavoprotein alpha/beta subunit